MRAIEISITSEAELPGLAKSILQFAENRKVFAFYAQMGAGKTTIIKAVCRQLGSTDNFSSPTYGIANEYEDADGKKIYHLDLYRLKNINEALDIGVEEYLTGTNFCFIEWPELVEPLLPADTVRVDIKTDEFIRHVSVLKPE